MLSFGEIAWKGSPLPALPLVIKARTSRAVIASLARRLGRALEAEFSPEKWIEVVRAIDQRRIGDIEALLVPEDERALAEAWGERFVEALGGAYVDAANGELRRSGARMELDLYRKAKRKNRFPGVPHDDGFIRRQAAALVVRASRDQRQAIREALIERYNNEKRPESLVRDIRRTIGLDPRRARALRNFEDKLVESGARNVDAQVERYRRRLLQSRAETIARTESVAIEGEAKREAWEIAVDSGALPPTTEKEWVTSGDPCPDCAAMDGQRVPVGEDFVSVRYGRVSREGLHPSCLCTVVLRVA